MRRALPFLVGAVMAAPAIAQDPEPLRLESAHYAIQAVGLAEPVAREYLALAEALHAQLTAHFGTAPAPKGKLEIRFWATREGYLAGGQADGIAAASLAAGGFYWTGTGRAYFWRQPSPYATRHLVLHECTHQFQYQAVLGNRPSACPSWYIEGLAEHFAWHRWDGTTLEAGQTDVLALEARIPDVVERARTGTWDLLAILDGKKAADYADAWAAVHFLLAGADPGLTARFRAQERKAWKGQKGALDSSALFGPKAAAYGELARKHVGEIHTTWKIEWVAWDAVGPDLVGESTVVGIVRTRASGTGTAAIAATATPASGRAGLIVGFGSTDEFVALDVTAAGEARLVRRHAGKWQILGNARVPPAASFALRLEAFASGQVRAFVDGKQVLAATVDGNPGTAPVGLLVDGGRARFSGIELPKGAGISK